MTVSSPPLGPLAALPDHAQGLKHLRILVLVTSVNSFTQRVISYLEYLGFDQVSVQLATGDEKMIEAAESWDADLVLCPFLTKKLPESIYSRWITLVVHPGPPGDAGPSSLDWVLLGDDGTTADSSVALTNLLARSTSDGQLNQRSHWGTICFQANEELDGGAVWAWEQYALPPIETITKAGLYQGYHSAAAMSAVIHALCRVYEQTVVAGLPKGQWLKAYPKQELSTKCVTLNQPFLGGKNHDRPLLQSTKRRPDWTIHTAEDVLRILNASDSQPGAMLNPLTSNSKSSLFAYGAHLHLDASTIPTELYTSRGWNSYSDVPDGTIMATRDGAIFIKTRQASDTSAGIWITHGRVPRGKDKPIDPKIPMVEAIKAGGHGSILDNVQEWKQNSWMETKGEWQEVFVRGVEENGEIAQLIYWNFYNGAFTTDNCRTLLKALQWATHVERGDVKVLALMGGNYFSNGIALNTIEQASSPGLETWNNITAIDDIVSFLVGDTHAEVPEFLKGTTPLCERGIATIACVRGNAAAGGVALAAACDVVLAGRGVVLNPSYRGMGLHGSELHSYSYLKRCGPQHSATLLRAMKPLNSDIAHTYGLIDMQIGSASQTQAETEPLFVDSVRAILSGTSKNLVSANATLRCAPWATYKSKQAGSPLDTSLPLVQFMCNNKSTNYRDRDFPPLLHYRNEELSQMLLDSFHPVRSKRYHSRRYKFIRKIKAESTPARYMLHGDAKPDPEDLPGFDDAPGWKRGEEWAWAGLDTPDSLKTSEKTRIDMWYQSSVEAGDLLNAVTAKSETPVPVTPPLPNQRDQTDDPSMPQHMSRGTSTSSSSESGLPLTPGLSKSLGLFDTMKRSLSHQSKGSADGTQERKVLGAKDFGLYGGPREVKVSGGHAEKRSSTFSGKTIKVNEDEKEKDGRFKALKRKVKSAFKAFNNTSPPTTTKSLSSTSAPAAYRSKPNPAGVSTPKKNDSRPLPESAFVITPEHTTTRERNRIPPPPTRIPTTASAAPGQLTFGKGERETEWPCLVTGGEEWEEPRKAPGPPVEEVK
ncbi:hypothetical protein IAR55_004757 [Kwoniella newhampshirensis]|uniref:Methionyl-tRNA formyltransferase n=1 Tax=Kwoniella newhampshirensis TaxID=1651941 RepID=A0AAW0YWN2_9TREE